SDTRATIERDIKIIQKELPLDIIEFFCLTPLPGSEDHQRLWNEGVEMESDLNAYDLEHVCSAHPKMSKQEWQSIYRDAWALYYSQGHMKTLIRRTIATEAPIGSLIKLLVRFSTTVRLENVHPLQSGLFRLKRPSDRRPELPRERPLIFWPRFAWEIVYKHTILSGTIIRLIFTAIVISRSPGSKDYVDQALMPVGEDDEETLDLFTKTTGGKTAVSHARRIARLTSKSRTA
ncbi:MAG: radical SAM protein, partial [Alphaproteobacteria bacterium]